MRNLDNYLKFPGELAWSSHQGCDGSALLALRTSLGTSYSRHKEDVCSILNTPLETLSMSTQSWELVSLARVLFSRQSRDRRIDPKAFAGEIRVSPVVPLIHMLRGVRSLATRP
jgi:hypothetical protein